MADKAVVGINIAGTSRSKTITRSGADVAIPRVLPAGKAGTITTRTDDTHAVITLGTGHGITTANLVDVGWVDGSGLNAHQARCTVSGYDSTTITISGGAGANLPAAASAVMVGKRVSVEFAAPGDAFLMLSLYSEPVDPATPISRAIVDFLTSAPASIKVFDLADDEPYFWTSNSPVPNHFAGQNIATIEMSSLCASAPTLHFEGVWTA